MKTSSHRAGATPRQTRTAGVSDGVAVDFAGGPAVDPTENVIALIHAATRRIDDLRNAGSDLSAMEFKRIDAALSHIKDLVTLRAENAKELNALESNRLNAIRQVDVLAVSTAADRAQAAIQALAAVTTSNAENLRNALTATATTIATQLTNTVTAINERIATLEKSSYTGLGKQAVADPQMAALVDEMRKLTTSGDRRTGKDEGLGLGATMLIGLVSLIVGMLTIGGIVWAMLKP